MGNVCTSGGPPLGVLLSEWQSDVWDWLDEVMFSCCGSTKQWSSENGLQDDGYREHTADAWVCLALSTLSATIFDLFALFNLLYLALSSGFSINVFPFFFSFDLHCLMMGEMVTSVHCLRKSLPCFFTAFYFEIRTDSISISFDNLEHWRSR